jgi:hypothetical protein
MSQGPSIRISLWQTLDSGLIVPSSVAGEASQRPGGIRLPPELLPPPLPVVVYDGLPHFSDQVAVRPSEADLGLTSSDLAFLTAVATQIPFEPAMLATSRLAAGLWNIHLDGDAQLDLARSFFDEDAPIIERFAAFVREGEAHVVFSEQQLFVTQRLLIEHARDGAVGAGMTHEEATHLKRLVIGTTTIVDETHLVQAQSQSADEILAYLAQNGAYNARQNMLNTYARAYSLFVERARTDPSPNRLPLDNWIADDYPLSLEEQMATGQALQAAAHVLDKDLPAAQRSLVEGDVLRITAFRDRMDDVRAMLAAPRQWYRDAFAGDGSLNSLVWETTPFMQRPFIELSSGQLLLISPRSIISWLGDGFYYRLLDSARRRNVSDSRTSVAYTKYVGDLMEGWAVDLVRSVYAGARPPGSGLVYGEQAYGGNQLTPDVAIDLGHDLVLIEVRSGYLTRELRVNGDVEQFRRDLDRVLLKKVRQLGNAIAALLDGRATLPDVEIDGVRRIWPILVTANITQTEPLHDLIEATLPPTYRDARVQAPLLLDAEDLEHLMGMVEAGASLVGVLTSRQQGPYRKLEFSRWANEDPSSRTLDARPTYALQRWERVTAAIVDLLQIEPPPTDSPDQPDG